MPIPDWARELGLYLPALLMGIGFHEWAHAYTAWRLGDSTPEEEGRLSLNPLDHLDPVGTIMIVIACVSRLPLLGWGKAVRVRPSAFRNPVMGMTKVAAAGPLMNVVQATIGVLLLHVAFRMRDMGIIPEGIFWENLRVLLLNIVFLNFSLAVFNMIPIPPLDGSKVVSAFVNADVLLFLRQMEPYGIMIIFGLLWTGILDLPFNVMQHVIGQALASTTTALLLATFVGLSTVLFVQGLER